jgi:HD superfamily phosphohydrolase
VTRAHPASIRKTIFDPVHGVISVEGAALELIGHARFQRLWGIRQTGFAHLVFPGANHTRLEHSLGVYWVARSMAERLALEPAEREQVAVGGLLHDVGHAPFSHTLDGPMREVLGIGHEERTREAILDPEPRLGGSAAAPARSVPEILRRHRVDPERVADLVDPPTRRPGPPLLRSILHGAIDADRLDYLQRDAHYTGVAHGAIDASRLLDTIRSVGSRLVFAEKGRSALEGFLVGRALMYTSVYYHKTVRAAEVMAQAAVERMPEYPGAAAPIFDLTDAELTVRLAATPGVSSALMRSLLNRQLYKRAYRVRVLEPSDRRRWRRLAASPADRRQAEDAAAQRLGAPPGSVLFDLAGLEPRDPAGADWAEVAVQEGTRLVHPFRAASLWQTLAQRPPSESAVAIYVAPKLRSQAERRLRRSVP